MRTVFNDDLAGARFGRLLVLRKADVKLGGKPSWACQCDCGNEKVIVGYSLRKGRSTSCGCAHKEMVSNLFRKHGMSGTQIYTIWTAMVDRCTNPKAKRYKDYGGRGVSICDRWLTFDNFYSDMGDYKEGMSIDRIDNNIGYSPENCRWTDDISQANNKRNNVLVSLFGRTQTLAQWCREIGVKYSTAHEKMRNGVSFDVIFGVGSAV